MASTVRLNGMAGKAKNLPTVEEWTLDTYLALNEECEAKGITLINSAQRESMALLLLYNNLPTFVDYDNASCSFDSELFLSTIAYLKSLPTMEEYVSRDIAEIYKGLREETIRMTSDSIGQFRDYLELCVRFSEEEIVCLGSPTPNGGRPLLLLLHTYAITADSPVQDGAWAFVRYMLENGIDTFELPVYKPALTELAEKEMRQFHLYSLDNTSSSHGSTEQKYDPQKQVAATLTQEHVDAVLDLLENRGLYASATAGTDTTVKALIAEELAAYYADNITAEEAARRIQSRVSVYLAERAG